MARRPAAKKATKKPASKKPATKKPAAKKIAKKPSKKAAKPAKKRASKPAATKIKSGPAAAAYGATMNAVKQIEQTYKAIKSSGAALERSLSLSKLVDLTKGGSPAFLRRMAKLRARLQAAQAEYKQAYQSTLDKMGDGSS